MGATTRPAGRTRARAGLTRQRIVAAALDEIDAHGLHSLTMQGLARSLGAGTMSLYNHVRSKGDLLGAVSEHLWAEIAALAPPSDDPARWLESLAKAIRDTGRRHPNALSILAVSGVLPPPLLEVIAEQFDRSGGSEPDPRLVNGITTVAAFAIGWAVTEAAGLTPRATVAHETERQRIRRITRALPPETPDRLVDAAITVCAAEPEPMFSASVAAIIKGCGYEPASSRPGSKISRASGDSRE
ncbi:MAG: TetR/AcrR family transcriptional regulator [Actinomycetota bacterium]|nr:TetR/AcrR family transcriptional regulator [Actinomycetota bacterium]